MGLRTRTHTWIALGFLAGATSCTQSPVDSPEAARWWAHIEYLASDELEGRDTGSAGYDLAATYVADQFATYGAVPGVGDSFLQPISFTSRKAGA